LVELLEPRGWLGLESRAVRFQICDGRAESVEAVHADAVRTPVYVK
jgi:hypothetical protein